ncbi:MAG: flippase-like domain-containing protein [Bacteroidales bacterium]|nr:flippase-like domain-containing protein [Bacteroidales bacterium]
MGASETTPGKCKRSDFGKIIAAICRYVLPTAISVGLLLWFFHKVNFHEVMQIIARGCNFWWIAAMMLFTTLSLIIRGIRWDMQLTEVGIPKMPIIVDSCAIFGAYALNLVFPRLGEAWRCLYVSRREGAPFMTVVGTDFGDRTADLLCVIGTIILAAIFTPTQMNNFFTHYAVGHAIKDVFTNVWVWVGVIVVIGGSWALLKWGKGICWVESFRRGLHHVWAGFVALFHVKPVGIYLWLTLGIWVCYYLQTYVCFFSFDFTTEMVHTHGTVLGILPGLVCLVFGSCSTIIPSNGGLGPWTIAIAYALELFGVSAVDAAAYALVVWGMQAVMYISLGIFTAFYVGVNRRKIAEAKAAAAEATEAPETSNAPASK